MYHIRILKETIIKLFNIRAWSHALSQNLVLVVLNFHLLSASPALQKGPRLFIPPSLFFFFIAAAVGEGSMFCWWFYVNVGFSSILGWSCNVLASLAIRPTLSCFSPSVNVSPLPTSKSLWRSGLQTSLLAISIQGNMGMVRWARVLGISEFIMEFLLIESS